MTDLIISDKNVSVKDKVKHYKYNNHLYKTCLWYELAVMLKNDYFLFRWMKSDFEKNNEIVYISIQNGCIKKRIPEILHEHCTNKLYTSNNNDKKNEIIRMLDIWQKLCCIHKDRLAKKKEKLDASKDQWTKDTSDKYKSFSNIPGAVITMYNEIAVDLNMARLFLKEHSAVMENIEQTAIFVVDKQYMHLKQMHYEAKLQLYFALDFFYSYEMYKLMITENHKLIAHKKCVRCCVLIQNAITKFKSYIANLMEYIATTKEMLVDTTDFFVSHPYLVCDKDNFEINEYVRFMILLSNKYKKHVDFVTNASIFCIAFTEAIYEYDIGVCGTIQAQNSEINLLSRNQSTNAHNKTTEQIEKCENLVTNFFEQVNYEDNKASCIANIDVFEGTYMTHL